MATYTYAVTSPIAMTAKSPYYHPVPASRTYAVSPPETADSVTSGSAIGPSYSVSGYSTTSSYAGSEYETRNSANGIDLQDYVSERFSNMNFDPLPLDRSLATQAQASGKLNNKQREIEELRAKAQARLAKSRARMQTGFQDVKEVKRDLEWSQKHVSALTSKTSRKHPNEYKQARARYPSPEY